MTRELRVAAFPFPGAGTKASPLIRVSNSTWQFQPGSRAWRRRDRDPAVDVLKQVPHRCAEDFSLVVTEERGVPEHLKGDEAMQVSPRDQQERGRWGRQISQAVMRQLVRIGRGVRVRVRGCRLRRVAPR